MPSFDITLNVYVFLLIIGLSVVVGYLPRSRQIAKRQRKIAELENEIVDANAEVLETQREFCDLQLRMKDLVNPVNPVINIKDKSRPTGTD
jgi:cell division protein FtsB